MIYRSQKSEWAPYYDQFWRFSLLLHQFRYISSAIFGIFWKFRNRVSRCVRSGPEEQGGPLDFGRIRESLQLACSSTLIGFLVLAYKSRGGGEQIPFDIFILEYFIIVNFWKCYNFGYITNRKLIWEHVTSVAP